MWSGHYRKMTEKKTKVKRNYDKDENNSLQEGKHRKDEGEESSDKDGPNLYRKDKKKIYKTEEK